MILQIPFSVKDQSGKLIGFAETRLPFKVFQEVTPARCLMWNSPSLLPIPGSLLGFSLMCCFKSNLSILGIFFFCKSFCWHFIIEHMHCPPFTGLFDFKKLVEMLSTNAPNLPTETHLYPGTQTQLRMFTFSTWLYHFPLAKWWMYGC